MSFIPNIYEKTYKMYLNLILASSVECIQSYNKHAYWTL